MLTAPAFPKDVAKTTFHLDMLRVLIFPLNAARVNFVPTREAIASLL
jgi:hypothetical protein